MLFTLARKNFLCSRAWYGSLRLLPGPIWKMSCNNL